MRHLNIITMYGKKSEPELTVMSWTLLCFLLFQLHLSLSLGSSGEDCTQETAAVQSLNLLLKSIGATLTDVDDLIFKWDTSRSVLFLLQRCVLGRNDAAELLCRQFNQMLCSDVLFKLHSSHRKKKRLLLGLSKLKYVPIFLSGGVECFLFVVLSVSVRLAFFEVKYQFYRREKLMWAVVRHYTEQVILQFLWWTVSTMFICWCLGVGSLRWTRLCLSVYLLLCSDVANLSHCVPVVIRIVSRHLSMFAFI